MARKLTIRVGQRLRRWDGITGYVDLNSAGRSVWEPGEAFQICWSDGDSEHATTETLAEEGITRRPGVMTWAR